MIEAWSLVGASLLLALAWFPASVAKRRTWGDRWLASNRETEGLPPLPAWGRRAVRAHDNLKENFPAWAALLLLVIAMDWQSTTTAWAAAVFPIARLGHITSYVAGYFWPRTICWMIGMVCTLTLVGVCIARLV